MRPARDRFASDAGDRTDARCLVFLHVPRTGGRTLRSSLIWNFPEGQQIHVNAENFMVDGLRVQKPLHEEMERIPLETRSKARIVWGHVPYGVHRYMPQRCEYFTVLREPVGRVISVYKYVLRAHSHALHDRVVGDGLTLEEYLEGGLDEASTENTQTRQLSGRQFDALDLDALEEAKRNLQACLVVGLTERFEETFVLLRRTLRLRMPFYITRNVSPPFQVSERAVELIRERNQLDLELYGFACDLFAEQLSQQNRSFGLEVSAYRAVRPLSRALSGRTDRVLHKFVRRGASKGSRR